mmetsp:Transcript_26151/g.84421  ORF Transcript_26151/g.84421 Transcript_26151/m.84421 type:complete len:103 (-) Transcript_26151:67-375(-)|eukprot:scaffold6587_cov103-Isochrysis_galbana.AAC.4
MRTSIYAATIAEVISTLPALSIQAILKSAFSGTHPFNEEQGAGLLLVLNIYVAYASYNRPYIDAPHLEVLWCVMLVLGARQLCIGVNSNSRVFVPSCSTRTR